MRELFSRRQAREKGELSDVFVYDLMPKEFRSQFCHLIAEFREIIERSLRDLNRSYSVIADFINKPLAKMKGVLSLPRRMNESSLDVITNYIQASSHKECIDAVDFILHIFHFYSNPEFRLKDNPKDLIDEANYWMKYHSLGYEFINDELIIKTNESIHKEIVIPSFHLLNDARFLGANEEMRKAYEFRRTGDNESAIIEANKAFESAMKSICDIMQYQYDPNNAASKLLGVLKSNNYFPTYLQSHLDAVNASIESGLPVVRNKTAGHGQGAQPRSVPNEYVDYALHILSTNLVFLIGLLPK